jgi:hypothetical protein
MGFWRFAANYLRAARAVHAQLDTEGTLLFPTLHLYGLAIELSLKAFLLKRGSSLSQLQRISHSLTKALAAARHRKLGRVVSLSRYDERAIYALDITYASNQLRYIVVGSTTVPTITLVAAAAERLVSQTEFYCTGAKGRMRPHAG